MTTTVYVCVGNSDDKLTQREWSAYVGRVRAECRDHAVTVRGEWYSAPAAAWQNACFCLEVTGPGADALREALTAARQKFRQDPAAWAVVPATEFI